MEQLQETFVVTASYGEFSVARTVDVAAAHTKEMAELICRSLNDDPNSKYRAIPMVAEVLDYAGDVLFGYQKLSVVTE